MRFIVSAFLALVVCALASAPASALTVSSIVSGIAAANFSTSPPNDIFAEGYWSAADGGGGYLTYVGTGCSFTVAHASYSTSNSTVTFTSGSGASKILPGMGISSGTDFQANTYVVSASVAANTIHLNVAPAHNNGSATVAVYGGDGGTTVADQSGNCFTRVHPTADVRAWGARCDVQAVQSTGSYSSSSEISTGSHSVSSTDSGKLIVIPGLGAGPYYVLGSVPHGTTVSSGGSGYVAGDVVGF
jgi:hypothetical protein